MNRIEKATLQLRAVEILRTRKESLTYDELAAETGLPAGDLNRYVNGHVLPGLERAREVVAGFGRETVAAELDARLRTDEEGYIDNTDVVFDQSLLDIAAVVLAEDVGFDRPDVVLTAATDGITFASAVARYYGARTAYAKKSRETAVEKFVEARQRVTPGIELTYSLPASAIDAGDRVFVVDDIVRSGETQRLLLDIADQVDAEVVGAAVLVVADESGLDSVRDATEASVVALTST
ncbi:Adenine/guanine phosphoribosyltransferase or related PRPP-binding protein [Halapricum desulfuricans]|uniref:Adenine/guanine phosphoribosyltransferase or related PRPP-binding protein n=1 Tax=Halapricum desulfuricans TaxID=2841257 RepID=A0A897NDZ3_9EURY|nr:phosphoribosyltransferase family protein [Halapricum desulfuricans]QSG10601.1 Adenine/guanine phosphoribosyltransferase or related PRPP-binding protein [Halapricum desulfuricans]